MENQINVFKKIYIIICIIFMIPIFSCTQHSHQNKIKVKRTEIRKTDDKLIKGRKISVLQFKTIDSIIVSTFGIPNTELEEVRDDRKQWYYTLLDSSKISSFKKRLTFTIIEFDTPETSKSQFKKIKDVAKKGMSDRKELYDYMLFFGKGGTSFNQIDKWIIIHSLRCNMYLSDHELDRQFTSELMKLNYDVDWVRNYCGWSKFEMK